jgi:hypothetical protein
MKTVGRFLLSAIILFAIGGIFFMVPEQEAPTQENPFITLQHIMKLAEASIVESEIHYWASLGPSPENLSLGDLESRANEYLGRIVNQDQNSVCAAPQSFSSESASIKSAGSRDGSGGSSVSTVLKSDVFSEPEDQKGFAHVVNHSGYSAIKDGEDPSPEYMVVEREQELPSGGRARLLLQHMDQDGQKIMHLQLTITREGDAAQLGSLAFRLPAAFRSETENSNLCFCLTGHIDGELTPAQMEQLARSITRKIGGEQVQSVQDGAMVSVTGYTPDLGDYLKAENLRINLNLAMRYDDYLGKTVIWAGTPLIAGQY